MIGNLTLFRLAIITVFVCFFASLLNAQQDTTKTYEDLYDMDLEALMNISVISSSKIKQKQSDAPNIIVAIPKEKIKKFGYQSINDILNYQPGFFPSQDFERRTAGFRGMTEGWNNNHLILMIDGIPYNDNLYGSAYTWDITPLIFANNIEIIRGPGGALYGTNAMNGVISINTPNTSDLNGHGEAKFKCGSLSTNAFDVITGVEGEKIGMVTSFSFLSTAGNEYDSYDGSGRINADSSLKKFKVNDSRKSNYFFSKIYGKGKYNGLSFQFHQQNWQFETGHGWLFQIPDGYENMKEDRSILSLRYVPRIEERKFNYEASLRYQRHNLDWKIKFMPDGTAGYPFGVEEYLNTFGDDVFARMQADYKIGKHVFLVGFESDYFYYKGDKAHTSNIDMNTWATPDSINNTYQLNPWFEFIKNKPLLNIAGFIQYTSPKFFDKLQLTASGRYDKQSFEYIDIYDSLKPTKSKSFELFTPKISAIFAINEKFSVKAILGKAFRTPSPTEMFGVNTYTLASNLENLKPEIVTNFDLGIEWQINKYINFRTNGFYLNFENIIAYSLANNNLSTNIYTLKTAGLEAEINFSFSNLSGFLNYTHSQKIGEEIKDTTIAIEEDKITWAPANTLNLGLQYSIGDWYVNTLIHYQDKVERRKTDLVSYTSYRPTTIDAWLNIDLRTAYNFSKNTELGLSVKNLLNSKQMLVKSFDSPFDYKRESRQILLDFTLRF